MVADGHESRRSLGFFIPAHAPASCNARQHSLLKNSRVVLLQQKWCALQVSNLQKSDNSLGNAGVPSQRASQNQVGPLSGLDSVVENWLTLPEPLKAAILAIIKTVEGLH